MSSINEILRYGMLFVFIYTKTNFIIPQCLHNTIVNQVLFTTIFKIQRYGIVFKFELFIQYCSEQKLAKLHECETPNYWSYEAFKIIKFRFDLVKY